jgi:hypothetical protein
MLGTASRKVCVMAIEMIKQHSTMAEVYWRRKGEIERRRSETRLMWMPGVMPVKIPNRTPIAIAASIDVNIFLSGSLQTRYVL